MSKRIPPKFRGESKIKPGIPLQERVRLLMDRIHAGGKLWPYNDAACVKECIKRGLIKRGRRRLNARWAHNVLVPLVPAPLQEAARMPQPYAKRLAAMDAAGLRRRVSPSVPRPL